MFDRLILAIQFLTLLPLKRNLVVTGEALAGSMAWFPVVGAMQGALTAAIDWALAGVLPPSVRAGIVLLVLALTNGGLHLDGLADTVDGLAGGKTPEDRLRIMRDPAIGPIGAAFLFIVLMIQYSCLAALPAPTRLGVIFLFPVAGRWAMVVLSSLSQYARTEGGIGKAFSGANTGTLVIATVVTAGAIAGLLGWAWLAILPGLGMYIWLVSVFFRRRLGGVTGDVFGFQSETGGALFLVLFLIISRVA